MMRYMFKTMMVLSLFLSCFLSTEYGVFAEDNTEVVSDGEETITEVVAPAEDMETFEEAVRLSEESEKAVTQEESIAISEEGEEDAVHDQDTLISDNDEPGDSEPVEESINEAVSSNNDEPVFENEAVLDETDEDSEIELGEQEEQMLYDASSDSEYYDPFTWTDSKGNIWKCIHYKNKAAVYGVTNATIELEIPEIVSDEQGGLTVTRVIAGSESGDSSLNGYDYFSYSCRNSGMELYLLRFANTIEYIGENCFWRPTWNSSSMFSGLTIIELPHNPVLEIGRNAFKNCRNLQYVNYRTDALPGYGPQPVILGAGSFSGCQSLESFTFPKGSTASEDTLDKCVNLKEITGFPASSIRFSTLEEGVYKIEKISFGEGLERVWGIQCSDKSQLVNLREVVLPAGVTHVGGFSDLTSLKTINLPDSITSINNSAFQNCVSLTGIESLPAGVTSVGDQAFRGCVNLHMNVNHPGQYLTYQYKDSGIVSITLSKDVWQLYAGGLTGCKDLKSITVQDGNQSGFHSRDGVLYWYLRDTTTKEILGENIMKYPAGRSDGGVYNIPDSVASIDGFAFEGCNFKEIHIPASVRRCGSDMMASIGINDYSYPFDNMISHCKIYYIDGSGYSISAYGKIAPGFMIDANGEKVYHEWIAETVPLKSISFSDSSVNVPLKGTAVLTPVFNPSYASNRNVTWKSSNTSVAAVDKNGKVTGKKIGTAKITATSQEGNFKAVCTIKVVFSDVTDPAEFYYDYVYDMAGKGVVQGYDDGTFRPYADCNRAAVVTFLWRLMGKPSARKKASFSDLTGTEDFDNAISWAAENKITTGWDDNTFRPWVTCNRAAVVTFLWRAAGKPEAKKKATFSDMTGNQDFDNAISWAAENGITTGWDDNTFRPWRTCNRLAIVSFLSRYEALMKK